MKTSRTGSKKELYEGGVLKVDVVRFSRYVPQTEVQGRRLERPAEPLEDKKAIYVVATLFLCISAHQRQLLRQKRQGVQLVREQPAGVSLLSKCTIPAEQNTYRGSSGRLFLNRSSTNYRD